MLLGLQGIAGLIGQWLSSAGPLTGDGNNSGFEGYTVRQTIATAQLTATGGTRMRITAEASSGSNLTITKMYVQHAAAAGDAYDFASAPVQVFFNGGSASVTITAATQKVSDELVFSLDAGKNLVISFYMNGGGGTANTRRKAAQTGWVGYNLIATDDAITINTSGYSTNTNAAEVIMNVESFV